MSDGSVYCHNIFIMMLMSVQFAFADELSDACMQNLGVDFKDGV